MKLKRPRPSPPPPRTSDELHGETISDGAAPRCDDCGRMPKLDVYLSGGGYYIGTYCACGLYTRESGYCRTGELAQADLDSGTYGR